jgi:hypothetical protein
MRGHFTSIFRCRTLRVNHDTSLGFGLSKKVLLAFLIKDISLVFAAFIP